MKFTVWGRELQWRTSGRESTSFPTVSIEIPGKEEKKKTCISLMTGNSMASAAAALSLSKNSLSLSFYLSVNISTKSPRLDWCTSLPLDVLFRRTDGRENGWVWIKEWNWGIDVKGGCSYSIINERQRRIRWCIVLNYPAGMSPVRVVVLGNAFVADAQIPGRVSLVRYTVVVDAVVG